MHFLGGKTLSPGFIKTKTEADPDGAGAQTSRITETIYDDAGRTVASRYNTDSWTCTTYDTRGRVTQVAIPAFNGAPARTVTNNYAVSGNPLVTSVADATGTITTTVDLLGRVVIYTDANNQTTTTTYDTLGRLSGRSGPLGTEAFTYDNYNRLTEQKLDGTTIAAPHYDTYSRTDYVTYPTAPARQSTASPLLTATTTPTGCSPVPSPTSLMLSTTPTATPLALVPARSQPLPTTAPTATARLQRAPRVQPTNATPKVALSSALWSTAPRP